MTEESAVLLRQEIIAPLDARLEGLVALGRGAVAFSMQEEAGIEPLYDLVHFKSGDLGRGEFDC